MAAAPLGGYLTVVGTAVFIPLEVHELLAKVTWVRVAALVVNVLAVGYLLWTKRLFGLRGGHAAYQAERRTESLLQVEQAACADPAAGSDRRREQVAPARADGSPPECPGSPQ